MTMERENHALRMNSGTGHDPTLLDSSLPWESDYGRKYIQLSKRDLGLLCSAEFLEIELLNCHCHESHCDLESVKNSVTWLSGPRSFIHELSPSGNGCSKEQQMLKSERSACSLKLSVPCRYQTLEFKKKDEWTWMFLFWLQGIMMPTLVNKGDGTQEHNMKQPRY